MALRNIEVELYLEEKFIRGSFRGILTVQNKDILVLGNEKSSILFPFSLVLAEDIKIIIQYDKMHKEIFDEALLVSSTIISPEGFCTRIYKPKTKQIAYSTLVNIYRKYKTGAIINTDKFVGAKVYNGLYYEVIDHIKNKNNNIYSDIFNYKKSDNKKYGVFTTSPTNNSLTAYCNKIESKPAIIEMTTENNKNEIIKLMNRIINTNPYKYKVDYDYTKNSYSGQLG